MLLAYKPGVVVRVHFRVEALLGRVLKRKRFLIEDGKVYDCDAADVRDRVSDLAAERLKGKLTRGIVCGRITVNGKPLRVNRRRRERLIVALTKGKDDFSLSVVAEVLGPPHRPNRLDAVIQPPRYEITGVPPGKYWVHVAWLQDFDYSRMDRAKRWEVMEMLGDDMLSGDYSGEKTPLAIVVSDRQEVQTFNFDLKTKASDGKKPP
jgi:hypothetical protein